MPAKAGIQTGPPPARVHNSVKRVAILISGRGSNMMSLVERADGYAVVLVASDKPDAPGLTWADQRGIPTFTRDARALGKAAWEAELNDALDAVRVEAIALAGYMRLLSDAFVARWRGRIVNIHPSLLPLHKGLDTHARAIAAGDAEAGCSVHVVTEELDAGAVLGQARVPILPSDTPDTLAARVLAEEHRLYPRVLAEWLSR
jgi:formyltetrahydrofolate-dependent phosphoribosylglycinamide formyltransferase